MTHLTSPRFWCTAALAAGAALFAIPASAQDSEDQPYRTRVALGPQVYPSYPGSDDFDFGPFIDVSRARGDAPFEFEAPDQSFGFSLIDIGPVSIGPVANLEGSRTADDIGLPLPKVKLTVELGGAVEVGLGDNFRLYSEVRKGLGGHKGWIANGGADAVFRDGDAYLFSIGPRVTWSDDQYQDAWFGIAPEVAGPIGIAAYNPGGGIQAYGVTASFLTQLSERWGLSTYAKYDRLVGDAADSPLVRDYGSRDQLSGGLALSYTFGRGVD